MHFSTNERSKEADDMIAAANRLRIARSDFQNYRGRAVSPKPPTRTDGSESHPYLEL